MAAFEVHEVNLVSEDVLVSLSGQFADQVGRLLTRSNPDNRGMFALGMQLRNSAAIIAGDRTVLMPAGVNIVEKDEENEDVELVRPEA